MATEQTEQTTNYGAVETPPADPPRYGGWYDGVKRARKEGKNPRDVLKRSGQSIYYAPGCLPVAVIVLAIPVSMIIVGGVYFNHCPVQPLVPIWMIVAGSVGVVMKCGVFIDRLVNRCEIPNEDNQDKAAGPFFRGFQGILAFFSCIWLICGSVWVYSEYPPSWNPFLPTYCVPGLYYYAFALITATWVCFFLSCCCCLCLCAAAAPKPSDPESP